MIKIESPANPRVLDTIREIRSGALFLIEGERMLLEALSAGVRPTAVFSLTESLSGDAVTASRRVGAEITQVTPRVLAKLSELPSTRGVVAVARPRFLKLGQLTGAADQIVVLLDGIQDPVNAGAISRSLAAFGGQSIIAGPGTASLFSPRAIRASAGSVLRLDVYQAATLEEIINWSGLPGFTLAGTSAHGGESVRLKKPSPPAILVVGSEGHGVSPQLETMIDTWIHIPMSHAVESLNAAVAASIVLYELCSSPGTSASRR